MQNTYSYFVNGELVYVPENELEEFLAQCEQMGYEYEEASVYNAQNANGDVQEFTVPKSQTESFMAKAEASGGSARPMTMLTMDDGNRLTLNDEDIRQFVQARATGQHMSRGLLKNTGIPELYGKSVADREALADQLSELFGEETIPGVAESQDPEWNLGDALVRGGNVIKETVAPYAEVAGAAVKGFGEGLARSVTDPAALYEETYGDGTVKNALLGAQDFANTAVRGGMDVVSKALGGQDTEVGRSIREAENELPTDQAETETGAVDAANAVIGFANDFSKNTLSTLMKYAAPGVAAVDIAGSVVDNYYYAYSRAIKSGASEDKANALASAAAGIGAAEGIWLAQSAAGGQSAGAVKQGLQRILGMGGKMGVSAGARDIVDQGIEGAENPDLSRTGIEAAKAAGEGALFEATSMAAHGLAGANDRNAARNERKQAEERAAEAERQIARDKARTRYEANLSDEALADIETQVNEMVKAEVIPSYRQAEEVAKRAAEKLTRQTGESAEAVQQAVMEAAQEVAERLQTPSRVETPALERRQTEAEMRNNERLVRRGEEMAEEIVNPPVERAPSDADALAAEQANRQSDLDAAFADYDAYLAKAEAARKRGSSATADTPEAIRDAVRDDAVLNRIDAEYRKAKTDAERNALRDQFKARVDELRGESAKTDTEPQKLTGEVSEIDGGEVKTDTSLPSPSAPKKTKSVTEMTRDEVLDRANELLSRIVSKKNKNAFSTDAKPDDVREWDSFRKELSDNAESLGFSVVGDNPYGTGWSLPSNLRIVEKRTSSTTSSSYSAPKLPANSSADALASARNLLKEKFYQDAASLEKQLRALPTKAPAELRAAYETAIAEAKKRNEGSQSDASDLSSKNEISTDEGASKIIKWLEATPEARDGMKIESVVNALPKGTDIYKIVSNKMVETRGKKDSFGRPTDGMKSEEEKMLNELVRYKLAMEGRMVPIENEGVVRPRSKQNDQAKRLKAEKNATLAEMDADIEFALNGSPLKGEIEQWKKSLEEAKANGESKASIDNIYKKLGELYRQIEVPVKEYAMGKTGKMKTGLTLDRLIEVRDRIEKHYGKDASKKYYEIDDTIDERADMRRLDPALRSDPKAVEWAQKRGFTVTDGKITPEARRAYDEDVTKKTATAAKRWFPDMKIVQHKYGENIDRGKNVIELRDTSGNSLGWFDPNSKETHLMPGANAETVSHEIMWHGTRDYAQTQAAKGDAAAQKLLDTMKDVEQNVPDALKNKVTRLYRASGVTSADVLFNEWGAWFTMGKGGKALEDVVATKEGQAWYAKALSAVKDAYKDYLSAHGGNRTDLAQIDGMTRDQFVDFLTKEFSSGKTLGEIGASNGNGKDLSTEETAVQKARRIVYDSVATVRDVERDIEKKTGTKIKTEDSVDAALALRPGEHEAVAINQQAKIRETKDMLKKYGLSSEDLGYYMALKAAHGRDAKVDAKELAKIEEDVRAEVRKEWGTDKVAKDKTAFDAEVQKRFDARKASFVSKNASHVDPREAAKIVPEIEEGSKSIEYGAARDKMREIQEDTLDTYVEAGLISKAEADKLRKEEPDYVPFKSDFDKNGEFVGRDTNYNNLAKKTFYEAKGRSSAAGDIIAHILNDNAMAHNKAIENKAREKLAKMVEQNPELGTVAPLGNRNLTEARRGQGGDKNVILFKREGMTYAIELNGTRGESIAAAFTGANQKKVPGWMQKASRAWAATATELSPTFSVRNVTKDNIELSENVIKEMGYVKGAKFLVKYAANQVTSAPALTKFVTTGKVDASSAVGKQLQEFIDNGGMIGGYGSEGYSEISRALSSEQIANEMKKGTSMAKAAGKQILHAVGNLNKFTEMTSRFNAYLTAVESGMTPKEAALWSRRTLTDFNRKGDMTGVTNVLRMFSNSTLGSTAKAATGLVTTKGGLSLAAGLMANGAAQAVLEHYMNADEDKKNKATGNGTGADVSEYDRKSSFWMVRDAKEGKITKVGSHDGPFQLINYLGNCAARIALGDMDAKTAAKELGMSVAELASAFSGWGSVNFDSQEDGIKGAAKAFIASVVPSVAQPLAEITTNTDYAGRKVFTEKQARDTSPNYTSSRKNTPEWAKKTAEMLNTVTGGNEARSGDVDVPAEVVQKIVESFGKNAAKDVITAWETGKAIINGTTEELDRKNVPFKRDFVRDAPDTTSRYFEAKREYEKDWDEYKKRYSTMSEDERKSYADAHPWVKQYERVNAIINRIDDLRHYENSEVKSGRGFTKAKEPFAKERVEQFKAERQKLQAQLLEIMGR